MVEVGQQNQGNPTHVASPQGDLAEHLGIAHWGSADAEDDGIRGRAEALEQARWASDRGNMQTGRSILDPRADASTCQRPAIDQDDRGALRACRLDCDSDSSPEDSEFPRAPIDVTRAPF
jgi:hypothetical protein